MIELAPEIEQQLALAGVVQAALLIQQIARTGTCDEPAFSASISSICVTDPDSPQQVFGQLANLKIGFTGLAGQLSHQAVAKDAEITRYIAGIVGLERKLAGKPAVLNELGVRVANTQRQLAHVEFEHHQILQALASTYVDIVSPLAPKIQIAGNPAHLKVESNQLSSLDLSTNTSLENLFAKNNSLECVQVADVNYANVNWSSHTDAGVSFSTDCADVWTIKVDPTILTTLSQIQGLDANNDGNITLAEAAAFIGELDLSNKGITLVDGLQAFTKITTLNLSGNGISDLSPLTGLTIELLSKNSNTTKTVSTTPLALENLILSNNSFETLNLESLENLKTVDISNNQDLVTLSIKNGKNEAISSFISTGTSKLTCILVDNKSAAYLSNWNIDANNSFANSKTDCRQNVLSVDDFLSKSLKIYPNPVKNILTIKLSNQVEFNNVTITNIGGKTILKSNSKSINISQFSKGIYFLKIATNKGEIIKKIIKI